MPETCVSILRYLAESNTPGDLYHSKRTFINLLVFRSTYHLDSDWVDVSRASSPADSLSDATVPSVCTTTRIIVKQCGEKFLEHN